MTDRKKIVWLASYPKSGNTWFRVFLGALLTGSEPDINNIPVNGIFSSGGIFEQATGLDVTCLYDREIIGLQSAVFRHFADRSVKERLFIKIHELCTEGKFMRIPLEVTARAIYFIRNPLDIPGSWAAHYAETIDRAVKLLNLSIPLQEYTKRTSNSRYLVNQKAHWSEHVENWTSPLPFPVLVIRFEDMLSDAPDTFAKALEFLGISASPEQVEKAIAASRFERLQEKERESGFIETLGPDRPFFRSGSAGNWKQELTPEQVAQIIEMHGPTMQRFNYL